MPADSKHLNSAFAISSFPDPGDRILRKLGDDCLYESDAPPHGLGWASHHLCAKWRGFSKQMLHVFRYRIRDLSCCRWVRNSQFNNWRNIGQRCFGSSLGRRCTSKQYLGGLLSNSDSELSQELKAQNGTCHYGLQKFGCKQLALKLDGFLIKTPRGDWLTFCSLKQGAVIGHAGNNTQCCPSVQKIPMIRQLVR
jgi:hypothetical protein